VKIEFKNQNGEIFSYDKTYTPSDSKASFLWKCENKGKVAVTVIYNKRNPNKYYIKELEELKVNENSKIAETIIGGYLFLRAYVRYMLEFLNKKQELLQQLPHKSLISIFR